MPSPLRLLAQWCRRICSIAWVLCRVIAGRPLASTRTAAGPSSVAIRPRTWTPCGVSTDAWRPLITTSDNSRRYSLLKTEAGPHFLLYLHDHHTGLLLLHTFTSPYARSAFEYALARGASERWPDYVIHP